jgi:REP element-mobilizing transposase RayT
MESLREGYYYHIYNRGAGRNKMFFDEADYRVFLEKYEHYLKPAIDTFAWCLIENHFHILIRLKTVSEQVQYFQCNGYKFNTGFYHGSVSPEERPYNASKQISHLMNSYTRYINKKKNRSGTLIEGPFKRKRIQDDSNFLNLVCYIHRNPIHHRITLTYKDYPHSSFHDVINNRNSFVEAEQLIDRFGGLRNFKLAHDEFRLKMIVSKDYLLE